MQLSNINLNLKSKFINWIKNKELNGDINNKLYTDDLGKICNYKLKFEKNIKLI
jgi:hypothetical protein